MLGGLVVILSAKFFPKAELGFRENLIKISSWASYLAIFGFNYTLLIFGQKYPPGHKARPNFLLITLIAPLILTCITCAAYFIAEPYLGNIYKDSTDVAMMRRYLILFPLYTFVVTIISWLEGYLLSMHKTALQSFAREILVRVLYIALIVLFAFGIISFTTFMWLFVVIYAAPIIFLLYIAMRNPGFSFGYIKGSIPSAEIKEIFRFSGYHMLTVASTVLILQTDAFLLAPLEGFEMVAIYSIAALAVSMLRNPTKIVGLSATPAFAKSYNEGNMDELHNLFTRSSVNMQIMGVGMFVLVYLNIDNIQLVMGIIQKGYDPIRYLVMILMIGQLADMVTGLNYELIGVTRYYRFNFWIALALLAVVFILNYFLIRLIGIYGAAWATSISLVLFNIAKVAFLWKKMNMQPFSKGSLYVFVAGGIIGGLLWLIPYLGNVFVDVAIRSMLFCMLFWIAVYKGKVSEEVNNLTHNILHKRRLY